MPFATAPASLRPSPIALFDTAAGGAAELRYYSDARYIRLRHGVYALRLEYEALPPWDRYLARVHAYARRYPSRALAGPSAGAMLGLPVFGEPRLIHVFDDRRGRHSRRQGDVVIHTGADDRAVHAVEGILLTSFRHTVLDAMRLTRPAFAVAIGDAALAAGDDAPSQQELTDLAASQTTSRGRTLLGQVLPLLDQRSESPGESVSRAVILWLGFEPPELQREFPWELGVDRVDFAWPSVRALGEFDGLSKYVTDTTAETAAAVIAEKHREDRLRRKCRSFGRWGWSDAVRVQPLEQRLLDLGVPRVGPRREALLRSTWSES